MLTMDGNQEDSLQSLSTILYVKNLTITYKFSNYSIKVVNRANIHVDKGEKIGIVGESGSGKTSLATAISGLLDSPPAIHNGGKIIFDGKEIDPLLSPDRNRNGVLGLNMVFQEPLTSLNPVYKVRDQLMESMIACGLVKKDNKTSVSQGITRIKEMLTELSIDSPEKVIEKFPHELSGGMRQRIAIALALLQKPRLVIMDEPTTGLDTIVQVKLLKLLSRMQLETGLSLIIITHDLTVAAQICDRIYVMYAGRIVEYGKTATIIKNPRHPYTSLLLSSIPSGFYDSPPLPSMRGDPPDMRNMPKGCAFSPRCPFAFDRCHLSEPGMAILENNQGVACFLYE